MTYKTKSLEIWDVATSTFMKHIEMPEKVIQINWCPANPKLILVHTTDLRVFIIRVTLGAGDCELERAVTSPAPICKWHPRIPNRLLYTDERGRIYFKDTEKNEVLMEYS